MKHRQKEDEGVGLGKKRASGSDNKLSETEIKKTIPFTIASKSIKYLGINVIKEVKDTENHKT